MKTAITGATGLVGKALSRRLLLRGDRVTGLTRDPVKNAGRMAEGVAPASLSSDPAALAEVLSGHDAVVNLAGEPVLGRRWNDAVRREIRDSRVKGTRTVVEAIAAAATPPGILVNASAVGYYGDRGQEELPESAAPGTGFLTDVCTEWEDAARAAEAHGTRVVMLRIGVVLSVLGGALPRMLPPFRLFVGGPIGNGRQAFPWIHIDDLTGLILHALDTEELTGPMNATAPHLVSNAEFSKALGRAIGRPSWLPAPQFALRLLIGPAAAVLTASQKAIPRVALDTGYSFLFPELDTALTNLLTSGVHHDDA
jgi:uncharacterized protein